MKNKKTMVFGKFHWLDLGVIILVIALAFGAFYKFRVLDKTSSTTALEPISYTVQVKKVRSFVNQNVKEGDILYDKTSGNAIGTIVKMETTQAKEAVSLTDGTYKLGDVENRLDVLFTIEAQGNRTDTSVFVNKTYELVAGSDRKFMTKYFECDGKIKQIF